jgi:chorismate dehydratase
MACNCYAYLCKMQNNFNNAGTPLKVGAVSYLNTCPLTYGFEKGLMNTEISLVIDYPANIALALIEQKIDIGLVPVVVLPQLPHAQIISNYGIAADGAVASVCLFSEVPLLQIEEILLDYESRTSVMLVKYLCKHYWKINPVFKPAQATFRSQIKANTAAVVIGDRAFEQRLVSTFCWDLGEAWKLHTGLPFVFAAWVSNSALHPHFIERFNAATSLGLQHFAEIEAAHPYVHFNLHEYYTRHIQYLLTDEAKKGMALFLNWCKDEALQRPTLAVAG